MMSPVTFGLLELYYTFCCQEFLHFSVTPILRFLNQFRRENIHSIVLNYSRLSYFIVPEFKNVSESAKDLIKHMITSPEQRYTAF